MDLDNQYDYIRRMACVSEEQLYDVVRLLRKMGVSGKTDRDAFENYCEIRWRQANKTQLSVEALEHIRNFLVEYDLVSECIAGANDKVGDELEAWKWSREN